MKELLLIRHAKSSWENPNLSDFNRPLNERGKKDAPKMADWLHHQIKVDFLLGSTAVRAKRTADVFIDQLNLKTNQYAFSEKLYHASPTALMKLIRETNESINSLLLVAHNPGLNDLANYLVPDFNENIPTCGIFWVRVETIRWQMINPANTSLHIFQNPKNLI